MANSNRYYLAAAGAAALLSIGMWYHDSAAPDSDEHDHDHEHEEFVVLTPEQRDAAGIRTEAVKSGYLQNTIHTHGKIVLDRNHVAHVIPKLAGVVAAVNKNDGEDVEEGDA